VRNFYLGKTSCLSFPKKGYALDFSKLENCLWNLRKKKHLCRFLWQKKRDKTSTNKSKKI